MSKNSQKTTYEIVDRLHAWRAVRVPADRIASTVSAWLAELDGDSPLAEALARATRAGDWSAFHTLEDTLSVDVMVAA